MKASRKSVGWSWWFVLVPILAGAIAYGFSSAQPRSYTASATLLAGENDGFAGLGSAESIVPTVNGLAALADDEVVVRRAVRDGDIDIDVDAAIAAVTATSPPNTQTIRISATDRDPTRARDLANAVGEAFSSLVESNSADSTLSVVEWQRATTPTDPSHPRVLLNVVAAVLFGTLAAVAGAFGGGRRRGVDAAGAAASPAVARTPEDVLVPAARTVGTT